MGERLKAKKEKSKIKTQRSDCHDVCTAPNKMSMWNSFDKFIDGHNI